MREFLIISLCLSIVLFALAVALLFHTIKNARFKSDIKRNIFYRKNIGIDFP